MTAARDPRASIGRRRKIVETSRRARSASLVSRPGGAASDACHAPFADERHSVRAFITPTHDVTRLAIRSGDLIRRRQVSLRVSRPLDCAESRHVAPQLRSERGRFEGDARSPLMPRRVG